MVDDHAANLLALEAILGPLGHRLVKAHSGDEALKQILQRDFALILLDVADVGDERIRDGGAGQATPAQPPHPDHLHTALSRDAENVFHGYSQGASIIC